MDIKEIYVGSWYPRMLSHLEELHRFLNDGTSYFSIDSKELKRLWKNLSPEQVKKYQIHGHHVLTSRISKYDFESRENGLTIVSLSNPDTKNINKEMNEIRDMAFKKIFPSLNYLYSKGAPIPKIFAAMKSVMPYVIISTKANKKEILSFFEKRKEIIEKEFIGKKVDIYYSQTAVLIIGDLDTARALVKECIYYIHDSQNQFHRILNMHRFIWEEIKTIKSSKIIKYYDLTKIRDLIMEIESEVVFFKSRINQIENVLKNQTKRMEELVKEEPECLIYSYMLDSFKILVESGEYIKNLWEMTNNYLSGVGNLVTSVYQESSDKQIKNLQFIFIISAIASILTLSSIAGFDLVGSFTSNEIRAKAVSFNWRDFISLGSIAIIAGFFIYFIWGRLYNVFAGSKISNPEVIANSEFEKIKKMLG